ncbi:hypothetical protein LINGRAHAP2_LOCUS7135 [Linum grandiflorum]
MVSTRSQTTKEKLAQSQGREETCNPSNSGIEEGDEVESLLRPTIIGHKRIEEDEGSVSPTVRSPRPLRRQVEDSSSDEERDEMKHHTLQDYTKPSATGSQASVAPPTPTSATFELRTNLINLIHCEGQSDENPCTHLVEFLSYCDTIKIQGASDDYIRLMLFKWSLRGQAKRWLNSQPGGKFTTWADLSQAFVEESYPPSKTASIRESISRLHQKTRESLYDFWSRYQNLLAECPHHGYTDHQLAKIILRGLDRESSMLVNQLANGDVTTYTPAAALVHLSSCATKSRNWSRNSYNHPINVSAIEMPGTSDALLAKIEALESKIEKMSVVPNPPAATIAVCAWCGICDNKGGECKQFLTSAQPTTEEVDFVQQGFPHNQKGYTDYRTRGYQNRQGNNYPYGGRTDVYKPRADTYTAPSGNFQVGGTSQANNSYRSPAPSTNQGGGATQGNAPPGFTAKQPTSNTSYGSSFEDEMRKHMKFITEKLTNHESVLQGQQANQQRMEAQIAKIMQRLEQRPLGQLPSNTEANPNNIKGNGATNVKEAYAISLRSGTTIEGNTKQVPTQTMVPEEVDEVPLTTSKDATKATKKVTFAPIEERHDKKPYPGVLKRKKKDTLKEFKKFQELMKNQEITLSFLEVFTKIPAYAKFLKEMLKKNFDVHNAITESKGADEESSSILITPTKQRDPGSFTLPCTIQNIRINRGLADLGASVNVMPYSLYKQLALGELRPTDMILQLANKASIRPRGIIEDVLVTIGPFEIPADFTVLDTDEFDTNILLRRPFLATAQAVIDVNNGCLSLTVGQESVTFRLKDGMKHSHLSDDGNFSKELNALENLENLTHSSGLEINFSDTDYEDEEPMSKEEIASKMEEVRVVDTFSNHGLKVGDKVMLEDFKSRINPSTEPVKSTEPFEISKVFMYGTIEIIHLDRGNMRIGAERLMLLQPTRPHGQTRVNDLGKSG